MNKLVIVQGIVHELKLSEVKYAVYKYKHGESCDDMTGSAYYCTTKEEVSEALKEYDPDSGVIVIRKFDEIYEC